ncbi:programmed cell death protein 2-like isoform X1 [Biomphalaria glabrata]|uniref:Programmed cell death protein 2-like isoform X1 n=1 Tax=Biomphalaria glabrata TaxID=6526 RepID=A0A9U8EAH2_BIOGL|nr:programmed cell death protein 2-like isoform X1 [Biomphalaria glabrata]
MMADSTFENSVKLGFIEEDTDLRLLRSHFFPSKVGGKPSWLSLSPIPESENLQCMKCKGMLIFLMQVYAPLQIRDDTFHRTIFVFICPKASCCSPDDGSNFKILRSQLSLVNSFFSSDPPNEELRDDENMDSFPNAAKLQSLCYVCGIKGNKKCSQCKRTPYCSKEHQLFDWKAGHKQTCSQESEKEDYKSASGLLFKEFELVTEEEEYSEGDSNNSKSEEERLMEYERLMRSPQLQGLEGKYQAEELEKSATAETEDDKIFLKFKRRIGSEPTQVLRYERCGVPLWVSSTHQPTQSDIPNCSCGAPRIFEFQVMPQLLNYLAVDRLDASLDWGTLCIYTCKNSCSIGNMYKEEFLWKQDFQNAKL